jgi:hypothetical protein
VELDGPWLQFALAKQVGLIRAEVVLIQLVGRPLEVSGEPFGVAPSAVEIQRRLGDILRDVLH